MQIYSMKYIVIEKILQIFVRKSPNNILGHFKFKVDLEL